MFCWGQSVFQQSNMRHEAKNVFDYLLSIWLKFSIPIGLYLTPHLRVSTENKNTIYQKVSLALTVDSPGVVSMR